MPIGTLFISPDWHHSDEGIAALHCLRHKQSNQRRPFYCLEKPLLIDTNVDVFEYKIFLLGDSFVGKSSIAAKLSANVVAREYKETLGIQLSTVYWPAKLVEVSRTVLFKLQLWDCGHSASENFSHLLPALKDRADGVMLVFSFIDKSSFTQLPVNMTRLLATDNSSPAAQAPLCRFVVGTKQDRQTEVDVTPADVSDFEHRWSLKVLCVPNVLGHVTSLSSGDCEDVAPLLNYMCDQLWTRDQIIAGKLPANAAFAGNVQQH